MMKIMRVDTFLVERFMNTYEHHVELNLAETCIDPFTLKEFLALMDQEDFFDDFKYQPLSYGYIEGSPKLRKGLANQYTKLSDDNILITGGAIGANFLVFYTLIEPGNKILSIFPAYQQLYSTAKSFGATVELVHLQPGEKWLPNLYEMRKLVKEDTKLIVINNPHNPTGSLLDYDLLKGICSLGEEVGAYVLCDEAYRGIYIDPDTTVPSAVDINENVIISGSFSKSLSLTGLRLGWIAAAGEIIEECMRRRDYTTISNGIIDDALAAIAMENVDRIYQRNNRLIRKNFDILKHWIEGEPFIDWVPPKAGSVAFLKHHLDLTSEELCVRLIREKGTFLVPSSCFEMEGYVRIGYGCKTEILQQGLTRLKDFLDQHR